MKASAIKLAVTGANGYIGGALISTASKRGWKTLALSRKPLSQPNVSWIPFDLNEIKPIALPQDIDVLIHLAAHTTTPPKDEQQEIEAARNLLASTIKCGTRFIFVSSQTAQENAPTAYGRIKWQIEQEVIRHGGWVIRPGQVYGGKAEGLYGRLIDLVDKWPLIPSLWPSPHIQAIHIDDLIQALITLIEHPNIQPDIYCLGHITPMPFSGLLKYIATYKVRSHKCLIPIPTIIIRMLNHKLKNIEGLNRLISLIHLPKMDSQASLETLKIQLRPFDDEVRRRRLLSEAKAFFAFILKKKTTHPMRLRRYVRMIEAIRQGFVLNLPPFFLTHPRLFALLDPSDWKNSSFGHEFSWRLDAATLLVESTPEGATRFLNFPAGKKRTILFLIQIGINELNWRILRCIFKPFIRQSVNHENRF